MQYNSHFYYVFSSNIDRESLKMTLKYFSGENEKSWKLSKIFTNTKIWIWSSGKVDMKF